MIREISCNTKYIGKQNVWLSETDSTNEVIKRLVTDGVTIEATDWTESIFEGDPREGLTVVTDNQTAGRGRRGREWVSENNRSLTFSVLLEPKTTPDKMSMLTLVAAMAVCSALQEYYGIYAGIKWPNDIVIKDRKVGGILTELVDYKHVIVGIGINVNQTAFPEDISGMATSIAIEGGECTNIKPLLEHILEKLEAYYERFMQTTDMSVLKDEYSGRLVNRDRRVRVLDPQGEYEGVATGIDDEGCLLVEDNEGLGHTVYAGEVSVRGIYGYV